MRQAALDDLSNDEVEVWQIDTNVHTYQLIPRSFATAGIPGPQRYFLVILMLSAWVAVCVAPSLTEIVKL